MQNTENTPHVYTSITDVIAGEIADVDTSWIENARLNEAEMARAMVQWTDAHDEHGNILLNHSGFIVKDEYLPQDGVPSDAFWALLEAHLEPYADTREQTLTLTTHEGTWEADIEWRPLYALGVDETADQNGATALIWDQHPPVRLLPDRTATGTAALAEDLISRSGDISASFAPEAVTDPRAELEPGQYRLLSVTCDGQPAELPTVSSAELNS